MPLSHYMQPFEAQKHAYKMKAKKRMPPHLIIYKTRTESRDSWINARNAKENKRNG